MLVFKDKPERMCLELCCDTNEIFPLKFLYDGVDCSTVIETESEQLVYYWHNYKEILIDFTI